MADKTSQQILADYQAKMGDELGLQFHRLENEAVWLHAVVHEFEALYATKPTRLDLMNKTAPGFFYVIQDTLSDAILLNLARLTDRPKTAMRETLTIRRLPALVPQSHRESIERHVTACVSSCEFARDRRNRVLAHRDLAVATGREVTPVASATLGQIREALNGLVTVLNGVQTCYGLPEMFYGYSPLLGNAETLLGIIADGLEARAERHERILRGEQIDFKRREI